MVECRGILAVQILRRKWETSESRPPLVALLEDDALRGLRW